MNTALSVAVWSNAVYCEYLRACRYKQYGDTKQRPKPLDEIAREHRRKMEAEHVETMRGAKVGTWLLGALFIVVVYAAAQLAGFVP